MTIERKEAESFFYYFAYGSCMCPIDLQRTLGEEIAPYVVGNAILTGYRLGFYFYIPHRNSGALDLIVDLQATVHGVLYRLPQRLSDDLDLREAGYRHEIVTVSCRHRDFDRVRTYVVVDKLAAEHPPNEWYAQTVMRGATNSNLPSAYRLQLHQHIQRLQQFDRPNSSCWSDPI